MAILPAATERILARDYVGALHVYGDLIRKLPELKTVIGWNVDFCCRRLLEDLESSETKPGHEYFRWVIQAMQASNNPELAVCLEAYNQLDTEDIGNTLISIIMPTWNREDTIGHAIRSVVSQTYSNWELLVCDDGSTDNTESVVRGFGDPRIHYFKLPKGNGAIARNYGLRTTQGKLITFLDSDNIWSPSFLSFVEEEMRQSSTDILYTALLDITIEDNKVSHANVHFKEYDFEKLAFRNFIDLNTLCIRSSLPKLFGYFDPRLPRQQDWDLLMRYACRTSVKGVNKPLVCYFRNEAWGQVTKTMQKIDTRSRIMTKNKSLIQRFRAVNTNNRQSSAPDRKQTLSIKISAPDQEEGQRWGDFHYAHSLGKCLSDIGWDYRVDCQDTWYTEPSDVALVLRGRHRYFPENTEGKVNFQWIISHPNRLKESELADFDHIFVASSVFSRKLRLAVGTPITTLYQACIDSTDCRDNSIQSEHDLLFIASSRNQKREMVEWCYDTKLPLDLYGTGWEGDAKALSMLKGNYVSNEKIMEFYRSSRIVLNDHWPDMRSNGFISNRIFDACAAGSLVITDKVLGLENVFGDSVIIAENGSQLAEKVNFFLANENIRKAKASKAQEIVLEGHTFKHRADFIDSLAKRYLEHYTVEQQ